MKIRSAVVSFSENEINLILKKLELPVSYIKVECADGKLLVRIKKGISFKVSVVFAADGRHLSATVDAGSFGNPVVNRILSRIVENSSAWGVTLCNRTLVFDPQAALLNAGLQGDFSVDRIAVGAGELIMALEGNLPLDQFVKKTKA
jgi:hypothetical protein